MTTGNLPAVPAAVPVTATEDQQQGAELAYALINTVTHIGRQSRLVPAE